MAQDAINAAVKTAKLGSAKRCYTGNLCLVGGQGFTGALFTEVAQTYVVPHRPGAIDTRVAKHLACESTQGQGLRIACKAPPSLLPLLTFPFCLPAVQPTM